MTFQRMGGLSTKTAWLQCKAEKHFFFFKSCVQSPVRCQNPWRAKSLKNWQSSWKMRRRACILLARLLMPDEFLIQGFESIFKKPWLESEIWLYNLGQQGPVAKGVYGLLRRVWGAKNAVFGIRGDGMKSLSFAKKWYNPGSSWEI